MSTAKHNRQLGKTMTWAAAIAVALVAFYFMDHFVMSIQGLPLNWNLTPAQ